MQHAMNARVKICISRLKGVKCGRCHPFYSGTSCLRKALMLQGRGYSPENLNLPSQSSPKLGRHKDTILRRTIMSFVIACFYLLTYKNIGGARRTFPGSKFADLYHLGY